MSNRRRPSSQAAARLFPATSAARPHTGPAKESEKCCREEMPSHNSDTDKIKERMKDESVLRGSRKMGYVNLSLQCAEIPFDYVAA